MNSVEDGWMVAAMPAAKGNVANLPRDNRWLGEHLAQVWDRYFPDTPCSNPVEIAFAKRWKARLGMITLCEETGESKIRLNELLSHSAVPECIATITVAHELVHYSHGFGSLLPLRYEHPHRGGIVEKEIISRGLGKLYEQYLDWIDANWDQLYHTQTTPPRHLWLARRSGEFVRVAGEGMLGQEAAASVIRLRRAAPATNVRAPQG